MRRAILVLTFHTSDGGTEQSKLGAISGDLAYSDWGAKVDVQAPPADQTTDIMQMMNGG